METKMEHLTASAHASLSSVSLAPRRSRLVAWLGAVVMVAGAAVAAVSLDGPREAPAAEAPAVATAGGAVDADAARAARQARLDAMRERLDALKTRVDALPERAPDAAPTATPTKPARPVKPVRPGTATEPDDDDGPAPVVLDPSCLTDPLCRR